MNRVIKFRFFINQEKGMIYPDASWLIDGFGNLWITDDYGNSLVNPFKDGHVLMLFTGLLDKNNKEIYEGDIVKFLSQGFIKAIVWNNGGLCIEDKKPDQTYYHPFTEFVANNKIHNIVSSMEVIGNVWENAELIK